VSPDDPPTRSETGEEQEPSDGDEVTATVVPVENIPQLAEELTPFLVANFKGPIPPPSLLREYEAILPGFTERTLRQTEKIVDHRIEMERLEVGSAVKLASRGQVFAFAIALVGILAGVGLILDDKSTAGLVAIITPLAAMLAVFVGSQLKAHFGSPRVGRADDDEDEDE